MAARTALVIDDEPQIRRVVRHALAEDFGRILEAESGSKGIDLAAAERPALIVLDLGLPDISGLQVSTEIRKWSDAPILVLSARHSDQEKVALLDAGADDYVTKPKHQHHRAQGVRCRRSAAHDSERRYNHTLRRSEDGSRCPHTRAQWCVGSPHAHRVELAAVPR
jgi:DNA-binding response OmpR family regulator